MKRQRMYVDTPYHRYDYLYNNNNNNHNHSEPTTTITRSLSIMMSSDHSHHYNHDTYTNHNNNNNNNNMVVQYRIPTLVAIITGLCSLSVLIMTAPRLEHNHHSNKIRFYNTASFQYSTLVKRSLDIHNNEYRMSSSSNSNTNDNNNNNNNNLQNLRTGGKDHPTHPKPILAICQTTTLSLTTTMTTTTTNTTTTSTSTSNLWNVLDWAAYHRMLGFDRIFLAYDANTISDVHQVEGFQELSSLPFVTLYDVESINQQQQQQAQQQQVQVQQKVQLDTNAENEETKVSIDNKLSIQQEERLNHCLNLHAATERTATTATTTTQPLDWIWMSSSVESYFWLDSSLYSSVPFWIQSITGTKEDEDEDDDEENDEEENDDVDMLVLETEYYSAVHTCAATASSSLDTTNSGNSTPLLDQTIIPCTEDQETTILAATLDGLTTQQEQYPFKISLKRQDTQWLCSNHDQDSMTTTTTTTARLHNLFCPNDSNNNNNHNNQVIIRSSSPRRLASNKSSIESDNRPLHSQRIQSQKAHVKEWSDLFASGTVVNEEWKEQQQQQQQQSSSSTDDTTTMAIVSSEKLTPEAFLDELAMYEDVSEEEEAFNGVEAVVAVAAVTTTVEEGDEWSEDWEEAVDLDTPYQLAFIVVEDTKLESVEAEGREILSTTTTSIDQTLYLNLEYDSTLHDWYQFVTTPHPTDRTRTLSEKSSSSSSSNSKQQQEQQHDVDPLIQQQQEVAR